jgi:hypothetical protein
MSSLNAGVSQFLSLVFRAFSLNGFVSIWLISSTFAFLRYSIMFSGMLKLLSRKLAGGSCPAILKLKISLFHPIVGFYASLMRWFPNVGQFSCFPSKIVSLALVMASKCAAILYSPTGGRYMFFCVSRCCVAISECVRAASLAACLPDCLEICSFKHLPWSASTRFS